MKKLKYNKLDYHTFTNKDTSAEERKRLNVGDLWMNTIECLKCGDIITSNNLHDFKYCKCKSIYVDGGSWYGRAGGELGNMKTCYEYFNDIKQ